MLMAHKTEAGEAVVLISASWICRYSTHLVQPYITTYNLYMESGAACAGIQHTGNNLQCTSHNLPNTLYLDMQALNALCILIHNGNGTCTLDHLLIQGESEYSKE